MPDTERNQQLPATALAILGLLSFEPMTGYDLKRFADKSISHFYWAPAKSQVYAELRRLRAAGLVTEKLIEQESRPDKRVYRINDRGQETLTEWLNSDDVEPTVYKSSLLLRVFLGQNTDLGSLVSMIEQDIERERRNLESLKEIERECDGIEEALFTVLTVRAGISHAEASIRWSQETLKTLRDLANARADGASS